MGVSPLRTDQEWLEAMTDDSSWTGVYRNPGTELMFCRYVADGNVGEAQKLIEKYSFLELIQQTPLSDDPLTNLKYHFVEVAFMLSRFCVTNGMPLEEANSLAYHSIYQMDRCGALECVKDLLDRMILDYTGRMLARKKQNASSRQTAEAIDYVYAHLSERITVEDMAKAIKVSPSYLSRIFKQEMGISVSDYVRARKIDVAKSMLRYTGYSQVDIANKLAYSSQSHFIQQFHSLTGLTPKVYRDKYRLNGIRETE